MIESVAEREYRAGFLGPVGDSAGFGRWRN